MAILDGDMILSDAQAETTVATHYSTNVIDFGAAHVGHNQKVIITVNTAVTSSGTSNVTFAVQSDSAEGFGASPITHITTAAIAKATLVAGYRVLEFTLPWEVKRYLRVSYAIDTTALSTGAFNAWVENAIQTNGVA